LPQKKKKSAPVKHAGKRSGFPKLAAVLAIVVLLALVLLQIVPARKGKKNGSHPSTSTRQQSPAGSSRSAANEFRNDGTLAFLRQSSPEPLKIAIEIADEEEERLRGLMYRTQLPENSGMLFIFPYEEPRSFWMKNTYLSLDIIYVNADKEIVSIQPYTQPLSMLSIPSGAAARYVVEVIAGFTENHSIRPGDRVDF
jgi:uncharacterized membrane protein (UPF0127 family)